MISLLPADLHIPVATACIKVCFSELIDDEVLEDEISWLLRVHIATIGLEVDRFSHFDRFGFLGVLGHAAQYSQEHLLQHESVFIPWKAFHIFCILLFQILNLES